MKVVAVFSSPALSLNKSDLNDCLSGELPFMAADLNATQPDWNSRLTQPGARPCVIMPTENPA
jgi:hypothetical protein